MSLTGTVQTVNDTTKPKHEPDSQINFANYLKHLLKF